MFLILLQECTIIILLSWCPLMQLCFNRTVLLLNVLLSISIQDSFLIQNIIETRSHKNFVNQCDMKFFKMIQTHFLTKCSIDFAELFCRRLFCDFLLCLDFGRQATTLRFEDLKNTSYESESYDYFIIFSKTIRL